MRDLAPGSRLNQINGSDVRRPDWRVYVWDPMATTIGAVVLNETDVPPVDITPFVENVEITENIGYENEDNPATTTASLTLRPFDNPGFNLKRGILDDGVILRVLQGDKRVAPDDFVAVFTGTIRGRPGENAGVRGAAQAFYTVTAHGREERFLNQRITTEVFEADTDLGEMAVYVAEELMGLDRREILFGNFAKITRHLSNQLVDENALTALWHLMFPAGRKPCFDGWGRLGSANVRLDKSPARIYADDECLVSVAATPNDVEVNNSVVVKGLNHELTKVAQERQVLASIEVTTGYFDAVYKERVYYSSDRKQRAQNTVLQTRTKIKWSGAVWTVVDEFSGVLEIDTHHLRNVRIIIFVLWAVAQVSVALFDLFFQEGGIFGDIINWYSGGTIAAIRFTLQCFSIVTMALLLWAMSFIGRGRYDVMGEPFEYCYQELVSRHQLVGLAPEEVRERELRNDFLSDMDALDAAAKELLKREMAKDQVYSLQVLDDLLVELDDVVETSDGSRFYVNTIHRTLRRDQMPMLQLTAWKVFDTKLADLMAV